MLVAESNNNFLSKPCSTTTLVLLALVMLFFSAVTQAACSSYYNFATINEIHRSGNNTRFIEVKLLDASIASATYDNWNLSFCSVIGCTSVSLSSANDADLPYIVIEKPEIPNRFHMGFGDGTLEGGDYLLTDGGGNTIDYFSVNDFQNQWWGGNEQHDASCTPAFNWEFPGTNTHTISRLPDGTGDWSDAAGNSGDTSESSTNDNTPAPDGGVVPVLSSSNVTVTAGQTASFVVSLDSFPKAYDVTFDYTTIDSTAVAGTDYTSTSGTASILAGASQATINVPTSSGSSGGVSFIFFILNPVNATIVTNVSTGTINAAAGTDHFVINHDGLGISCAATVEQITVTAMLADGVTVDTSYAGAITLDTQTGIGTWTAISGVPANFNDATADDGLAIYTFDAADLGVATFGLDYQSDTGSIDVDVYQGATRDDDTEGNLVFSPSGFTVTAVALIPPFDGVLNTVIPAQTAATNFTLFLAAYGATPTNPTCGIIESYTDDQSVNFWSTYNNPGAGTMSVAVDGGNVATSEGASMPQTVSFLNGQASITVNYPDAGQIILSVKDDATGNPDLPNGINGSASVIVRPADFVLSNIIRTSDSFPNPAAANAAGPAFMAAGDNFSVTVTAVNSLGNTTLNFGQETVPESVLLTPTIVAAGGAANPAIVSAVGFGGFTNGVATGTNFNWPEVGVITLTPSIADADYLTGGGDVTGTASVNVGRFYPAYFTVTNNITSLETTCASGAFSYMEQSFGYSPGPIPSPTMSITAHAVNGDTTDNYDNTWWSLTDFVETYTHNGAIPGTAALDAAAAGHSALSCVGCAGVTTTTFNGNFVYNTTVAETAPFTGALDIRFTLAADADGACYDGTGNICNTNDGDVPQIFISAAISFDSGAELRSGRGVQQDVFSVSATPGTVVTMPASAAYYAGAVIGWTTNAVDSCTIYGYVNVDNDIDTGITPILPVSPVTLVNGVGDLTIELDDDAGDPGGSTLVTFTWPAWLGGVGSATATFGVFQGDDRYLYWHESP